MLDDRPARDAVPTYAPTALPEVGPELEREQRTVCPARQENEGRAEAGQTPPAVTRAADTAREVRRNLADRTDRGPVPHHGDSGGEQPPDNERSTP